jgi:hypothetical protein
MHTNDNHFPQQSVEIAYPVPPEGGPDGEPEYVHPQLPEHTIPVEDGAPLDYSRPATQAHVTVEELSKRREMRVKSHPALARLAGQSVTSQQVHYINKARDNGIHLH